MKRNNFFTSEKNTKKAAKRAGEILTKEVMAESARLKEKYGVSFARPTKQNAEYLWNITIDAFNKLPATDAFKVKLEILGRLNNWQSQDSVLDLMERLGYLNDYQYLRNWNTSELEMFVENELPNEYQIKGVTKQDLLESSDFSKFFEQFLIGNCDPDALTRTKETKEAFDKLIKGLDQDQKNQLGNIWFSYINSDMTFDSLHRIIFPS